MTFELFTVLLSVFSIFTSRITQAVKLLLDSLKIDYASNLVVLGVSIFVGGIGTLCAYIIMGIPCTVTNLVFLFLMIIANWIVAMLGYDKVMQSIIQAKKCKEVKK